MEDWIVKYWLEAIFGAIILILSGAFKFLSKRVKKQLCDQQAIKDGTKALLRSDLIQAYDHYMGKECIPIDRLDHIQDMYNAYHALGGNGTVTKLIEDLKELPCKLPKN